MSLRKFDNLTPAGKRMRIARDVLASMDAAEFTVAKDRFLWMIDPTKGQSLFTNGAVAGYDSVPADTIISEFPRNKQNCRVCALGAMMLCKLEYKNGLKFRDVNGGNRGAVKDQLKDYFDATTLATIESVFECDCWGDPMSGWIQYKDFLLASYKPGDGDLNEFILRQLMSNIIVNHGMLKMEPRLYTVKRGRNQFSSKVAA